MAAWFHQFRREGQAAQERAEAAITLSTEQGFPLWLACGNYHAGLGTGRARTGERKGLHRCARVLPPTRPRGQSCTDRIDLALLAEAYGKVGQAEEGLTVLTEALAAVDKTGERFYEAELYRLQGELTLQQFKVQGSKLS